MELEMIQETAAIPPHDLLCVVRATADVFDLARVGVVALGHDGEILFENETAARMRRAGSTPAVGRGPRTHRSARDLTERLTYVASELYEIAGEEFDPSRRRRPREAMVMIRIEPDDQPVGEVAYLQTADTDARVAALLAVL